jgi:hypothetical protein
VPSTGTFSPGRTRSRSPTWMRCRRPHSDSTSRATPHLRAAAVSKYCLTPAATVVGRIPLFRQ